ncbi:75 kDa invariant surface glycoprotein [Trypanosoma brucei equiperdum]|uniref:75 kDa invariant surface glycoprotein n=1 Tax=Trypanosoma brucei equiperdum TaxID=630700 RepID=A0A3L6L8B4_9TRYP|nr:75 kDa invariant surface glycoprotein [Trypanosoma brucei equiperdum]
MSTMPVTLRTTATVFLLCGICALDVSKASNLPVAYKQYVTMNGRKLDGEAVLTLCTMKKLLDGVNSRVDTFEQQILTFVNNANANFRKISDDKVMAASLSASRLQEMQYMKSLGNSIIKYMGETGKRAKAAAANASAALDEVLKWHCVDRTESHESSYSSTPNANCEPNAYKRDYYYEHSRLDPHKYSILCNYKVVSSTTTQTTFSNMERALEIWNQVKPKPYHMRVMICGAGAPAHQAAPAGRPCTVLENWLWNYRVTAHLIAKLEKDATLALRVMRYSEKVLEGDKESLAQHEERRKAAEARAAEEEAKRQAAEKAAEEARKALEEAEARRVAAEEQAEARRLEAEKAKEAGQPVSEEKKKMLLEAVEKAEATEKAAEKQAKDSRKAFEEAEEERVKATEDAEAAKEEKKDAEESEEKLKKDVEKLAEELKEESKESGEEDDVNADHDDGGSEAKSGWIGTTKVLIFLIPLLLLLLGLLVFFVIRGRRKAEVKDDINIEEGGAKSKNTKTAAGFDSDI